LRSIRQHTSAYVIRRRMRRRLRSIRQHTSAYIIRGRMRRRLPEAAQARERSDEASADVPHLQVVKIVVKIEGAQ
jgi:hypothetical protein